jgi:hypothetical protein
MPTPVTAEPLLGTWKVNLEKSNYGVLTPPRSDIATFAAGEGGVFKFTGDAIHAKGDAVHSECCTKLEGEECPVTGSPFVDTVIARRIDARTTEWIARKQGKAIVTAVEAVSEDGRTLTGNWSSTDEKGQALSWTTVSDKQ